MVSIAIGVCTGMFFPYSKNVGAEFISKIDLASTPMAIHDDDTYVTTSHSQASYTVVSRSTKQLQWRAKCQTLLHCNAYVTLVVHTSWRIYTLV
jgi:hypothetical protein